MRFQASISYDDNYAGLIISPSEGERLANVMGDSNIFFMGNHGVLVAGASVAIAFNSLYYLERACMHQGIILDLIAVCDGLS
jgi:ribulose-5-phosphate 4-epimerase/fuculose-1-phosphate aldolase